MPCGRSSRRSESLSPSSPNFDALYAPTSGRPTRPPIELTFTIRPASAAQRGEERLGDRRLADQVDLELLAQLVDREELERRGHSRCRRCSRARPAARLRAHHAQRRSGPRRSRRCGWCAGREPPAAPHPRPCAPLRSGRSRARAGAGRWPRRCPWRRRSRGLFRWPWRRTYPLASPGWTWTTPSGPAARTRRTDPSPFRARRSTSCSTSPAGRRTTTSRTRGASACSARSRSRELKEAAGEEAAAKLDRAPTLVVASVVESGDPVQDEEDHAAAAVAAYIVLLAAHARGLAGYWRTPEVLRTRRRLLRGRRARRRARDRPAPPGPAHVRRRSPRSGCRPETS